MDVLCCAVLCFRGADWQQARALREAHQQRQRARARIRTGRVVTAAAGDFTAKRLGGPLQSAMTCEGDKMLSTRRS